MTSRYPRGAKKVAGAAAAGLLAFSGLAFTAPAVGAEHVVTEELRLGGADRFATAAEIALETFDTAPEAIIARADLFPDALAGNGLAGQLQAPILLSRTDAVPQVTLDALEALNTDTVYVLGQQAAISAAVVAQLEAEGYNVERVGGQDRFETARDVALEIGAANIGTLDDQNTTADDQVKTAILTTGLNFPDSVAASALAYAETLPILLTVRDQVPQATKTALEQLGIEQVIFIGGTAVIGDAVENELGNDYSVFRVSGEDRWATAVAVAEFEQDVLGWVTEDGEEVSLARGDIFPDALTGGPHAGTNESPILLTLPDDLTPAGAARDAADFIAENCESIDTVFAYGETQAISEAVLDEAADLAQCEGGAVTVTATPTDVEQGGETVLTVTGEDIETVTVTGDCIETQTFTPANDEGTTTTDDEFEFTVQVNNDSTVGDCELTITTSFTEASGRDDEVDTVQLNVTERPTAAASVRPELIAAQIVSTTADTATTPGFTTVRFTFDEEITGVQGVNEALFHAYDQDGTQFDGSGTSTIESGGNSVLVRFADIDTAALASTLTLATVDFGAVFDNEGDENPIGDAPLGSDDTDTVTFVAGETDAPDLEAVQNFRVNTADNTETLVDFVFDENAFVVDDAGFSLITPGGEEIPCVAVLNTTTGTDTTDFIGEGTKTITVSCTNTLVTGTIDANEVARGVVQEDTVSDADQTVNGGGNVAAGNFNPLQASDTPDAGTTEPDLESVELRFNTNQATGTTDTVVFTFDEAVVLTATDLNANGNADEAGAQFFIYDINGDEIAGDTAVRGTNANQVIVTFADGEIDEAVGGSVVAGAVEGQTGTADRANEDDEEGAVNNRTNTNVRTAGRTDNPDLTAVRIEDNTATATTGDVRVVYVFDEDVVLVEENDFFLIQADGTRLVCTTGNAVIGNAEGATTNPDTDNTVICDEFAVADPTTGAQTTDLASATDIRLAVVGTVDDDAVAAEGTDITVAADVDAFGNPEGAELTTGGTGTPQA